MTEAEKDAQFYRDTQSAASPKLDDRQFALLEPLGRRRIVRGAKSSSHLASAISD